MRYGVLLLLSGMAGGAATTCWAVVQAWRNPSEARAFADEWITHPDDRLEAERAIEMIAQQSGLQ